MINKLLINGVDIEKELSDLNIYVDRYIEDADDWSDKWINTKFK